MDSQYAANVCTVLAPGIEYIWRHGAAYIQVLYSVESNQKREKLRQDSGDAKRRYRKERHQVGALQEGVLENM